jgi:riboflavin kinase/FMN adenylyltransferase
MELIRGLHNIRAEHQGCVATIGAFDGVHEGHRKVLAALTAKGKELGLPTVVIVFEPLPREYFSPLEAPARLMSFREKFDAFRELGIDRVMRIPFNAAFREMGAESFIQQIFVDGLDAHHIVVGDDFRFGRDQGGDFSLLKQAGEKYGFNVVDTITLSVAGDRASSSRIRQALEADDFDLAEQLLGRPYSMSGKVIAGEKLGRKLGTPTANLQLRRLRAALSGVYAVEVTGLDGHEESIKGVANIGTRPTVDDSLKAVLEVHLFDFDENIYGKNISVVFRKKIRQEKKFDSIEELKANIHNDIEVGKKFFNINYD